MREEFIWGLNPAGFHRIAMTVWGEPSPDPERPPVICVHGLTRNGRDFDKLAAELSKTRLVYCPDMAGRGRSDDLSDPSFYNQKQYMADMVALIARTGAPQVDWVGTSMGGITGLLMAGVPGCPIRRLVLNEVGAIVTKESLSRIKQTFATAQTHDDLAGIEREMRERYKPFGPLSDEDWAAMAAHGTRPSPDGKLMLAYDPKLGESFEVPDEDINLWPSLEAVCAPTLLLRGEASDLLPAAVALEMTKRKPFVELVTFPGIGHAPALTSRDQIEIVTNFLNQPSDKLRPGQVSGLHPN